MTDKGEKIENKVPFRTNTFTTTNPNQFSEQLAEGYQKLHKSLENFQKEGSGWQLDGIQNLKIHKAVYQPLTGSSSVPLPQINSKETHCRKHKMR